mmetsp:Transcript_22385/g.33076  ORF Transcript_22385/g.33076 Transcript_22385/m.33076 type:complete len:435 (-) Transcript_22385:377-1681(-)
MGQFKITWLWLLVALALAFHQVYMGLMTLPDDTNDSQGYLPDPETIFQPIEIKRCTADDLHVLKMHLPSRHCIASKNYPWMNKCSFSYATRCPSSNSWLGRFISNYNGRRDDEVFVGISIGCNKGYDAVDTAQWGTYDAMTFDKHAFRKAKGHSEEDEDLRCEKYSINEEQEDEDRATSTATSPTILTPRQGEMHCVEALPSNFKSLQRTAEALNLTAKGFIVSNAAISDQDGTTLFPRGDDSKEGTENLGMDNCRLPKDKKSCTSVKKYTLDSFVAQFVKSNTSAIHHLSIDIEGYDASALMGAQKVLNRTEYLEFEYNWMGDWKKKYSLSRVITMLEETFHFACYFIGDREVWRISHGCWQEHYSIPFWSNVGCVSVPRAPTLLTKMEHVFQKTLATNVSDLNYIRNPRQLGAASRLNKGVLKEISTGIIAN